MAEGGETTARALKQLDRIFESGVDPRVIKKALTNEDLFAATSRVTAATFLDTLAEIADVPGFTKMIAQIGNPSKRAKYGFFYEAQVAAAKIKPFRNANGQLPDTIRFAVNEGVDFLDDAGQRVATDIDLVVGNTVYQIKRSRGAFGSNESTALANTQKWVDKIRAQAKANGASESQLVIRYVTQPGVSTPKSVREYFKTLQGQGLNIDVDSVDGIRAPSDRW